MITRRERFVSLVAAVGLPCSIVLILLLTTVPRTATPVRESIAIFDVLSANSAVPAKPRPEAIARPKPVPMPPVPVPSEPALPPQVTSLLAEAARSGVCDLTAPVEAALRADPAVAIAVDGIPRDSRSVANAIMIWNEEWIASDERDSSAVPTIQHAIVATIDAATPECRNAIQAGPRFMSLNDAGATVMALGSDEWRWQDLVDSSKNPNSGPATLLGDAPNSSRTVLSVKY